MPLPIPVSGVSFAGSVMAFVGAGTFKGAKGAGAPRVSASARFRGLFGLPGHFPCPLPAAPVSWPGSSPPSSSSRRGPCRAWGFQGPVVLVWGLRFRGAPRQCCARSHVSGKPPTPHSGQAVLVTTSLREAGWVVTAAPPASVVCRLHVDFCH